MKNKILFLILIATLTCSLLSGRDMSGFPEDYIVRPGDTFVIQIITLQTQEMIAPVTITGHLTLYPISSPVKIAGLTLAEAKETVTAEISKVLPRARIFVDLYEITSYSLHILGAVNRPGEYVVDTLMTLYQSLQLAEGLSPAASKKIKITRHEETKVYNLNRYLTSGDVASNPLVFSDDLIWVDFAEEFAKLYVVTDTINYVEYFEMETEKRVAELLPLIKNKYSYSDYQVIYLRRDGQTARVDQTFLVKAGDNIYLHPEESYILVRGNVNRPGKFSFQPGKHPQYYISMAGGVNRTGSDKRIYIISRDGSRKRFRDQEMHEGDTVIVPLATRTWLTDYLTPISAIISMTATIIVLTR